VRQCAAVCGNLFTGIYLIHRYTSENSDFVTVRQCAAVVAVQGAVCTNARGSVRLSGSAVVSARAAVFVRQCCSVW
jgi:hypothetical protein